MSTTTTNTSTNLHQTDINMAISRFGNQLQKQYGNEISIGIIVMINGHTYTFSTEKTPIAVPEATTKPLGGYYDTMANEPTPTHGGSQKFLLTEPDTTDPLADKTGTFVRFFHQVCLDPDIKRSTQNNYLSTYNKLVTFAPKADFIDINYAFVKKFETWLNNDKCAVNTIAKHLKSIKKAIVHAIQLGYIPPTDDPFKEYKIHQEKRPKRLLTFEEVAQLDKLFHQGTLPQQEQEVLGAFLFGCYTGLRYSDLKSVKATNIKTIQNRQILTIRMQKTARFINLPLTELFEGKAIAILAKIGNRQEELFQLTSNSVSNRILRRIINELFPKTSTKGITFHTARRTMATLLLALQVPITTVQALLGHTSVKTTEFYAKVTDQTILSDLERCKRLKTQAA